MNIVRTLGIFVALAALSFVLGFFVLSRFVPGSGKPALASPIPVGAPPLTAHRTVSPARRQTARSAAAPSPVAPKPLASTSTGPSLDPSNDPPTATDPVDVQKPRKIVDDSAKSGTAFRDTGDDGKSAGDDSRKPAITVSTPKSRRRHTTVTAKVSSRHEPANNDDTGDQGDSTVADIRDPAVGKPNRTRRVVAADADTQGPTDQSAPIPTPKRRTVDPDTVAGPIYHVHLGSFHSRDAADQEVERALSRGFDTQVVPITRNGRTLYRVQAGAFRERGRAESIKQSLQDASLDASVSEQRR